MAFAGRVMDVDAGGMAPEAAIAESIDRFESFLKGIGVPVRLGEKGITEKDFDAIIDAVVKVSFNASGFLSCNPSVSREDLRAVLRAAL